MLRVLSKLLEAALGAEVVRLPFVVEVSDGVGRVDRHPAHGIEDALGRLRMLMRRGQDLTY